MNCNNFGLSFRLSVLLRYVFIQQIFSFCFPFTSVESLFWCEDLEVQLFVGPVETLLHCVWNKSYYSRLIIQTTNCSYPHNANMTSFIHFYFIYFYVIITILHYFLMLCNKFKFPCVWLTSVYRIHLSVCDVWQRVVWTLDNITFCTWIKLFAFI